MWGSVWVHRAGCRAWGFSRLGVFFPRIFLSICLSTCLCSKGCTGASCTEKHRTCTTHLVRKRQWRKCRIYHARWDRSAGPQDFSILLLFSKFLLLFFLLSTLAVTTTITISIAVSVLQTNSYLPRVLVCGSGLRDVGEGRP